MDLWTYFGPFMPAVAAAIDWLAGFGFFGGKPS